MVSPPIFQNHRKTTDQRTGAVNMYYMQRASEHDLREEICIYCFEGFAVVVLITPKFSERFQIKTLRFLAF